ncbi:MAG TPA: endo-1,4-beta-xylanase [Stellaceae bacterium]|nr:endo-1,4-beta-xylanase [Stellaceae bacterium]
MRAISRREVLAGTLALALATPARGDVEPSPAPALKTLAAQRGILYGSCAAYTQIAAEDDFTVLLARECGLIVPENEMKWAEMSPGAGLEDFRRPDQMVDFADAHGLHFRGHNMLWYWRTPSWFFELHDRKSSEQAILKRVDEMGRRYRGRIHSWDVVNEPLNPQDGRPDGLRKAVFLDAIGPDYLALAHHAARAADPAARLVVNEYDVEYDTPEQDDKRLASLHLIEAMKKAGTPVDAFGVQAHLSVDRLPFSARKLRRFLSEMADLEVAIQITELDVTDENAPAATSERDRLVADQYARFLEVALDEKAVKLLTCWGLSDRHSWIVRHETNDQKWRRDGLASRPLPFDDALMAKPAWAAIAEALKAAPPRDPG